MKSAQIKSYGSSEVVEINQSTPAPKDPSAGKLPGLYNHYIKRTKEGRN